MSVEQGEESTTRLNQESSPVRAKHKKKGRKWIIVLLLLLALGGAYFWSNGDVEQQQDMPLIATVTKASIENTIASTGSLQPFDLVDVGAQVSGQLQILHVEVGDIVTKGQLLAEIDARVQENKVEASRASIEAQEAQLKARKASLALAKSNALRQERLMAESATSQLEYDNAKNSLASAESSLVQLEKQIIQSKASLASDETQLEYSKIYAPAAGTVVSIEMTEGRTLNANQQAPTILRIAELSTMTVETEISEADIGNVKKGLNVYFTTLGGGKRRWYSTLRQILPTPVVESNVVLYTGLFDIDNSDAALLSSMTAQVYFITSSAENVLTVPVGALTYKESSSLPVSIEPAGSAPGAMRMREGRRAGGERSNRSTNRLTNSESNVATSRMATVQLVNADGTMQEREVVIGVTSRVLAEVISGLKEGDQVVAGIIQAGATGGEESSSNNNEFRGPPGGFGGF